MNEQLIEYYRDLLIIQYQKPKARATIEALIRAAMIFDLAIAVRDGYDIDTAVGAQQDILGKYLGIDRIITGFDFTRDFFGYAEYGDDEPFDFGGYIEYETSPVPDVQYRRYEDARASLFALNDEEFRQLQRLRVIQNTGLASMEQIDSLLFSLFEDQVVFTDRENMTLSYIFQEGETIERLVLIAQSEGFLPKPAGVGLRVSFTTDIDNIFGYSVYGSEPASFMAGYGEYGEDPVGGWAVYG